MLLLLQLLYLCPDQISGLPQHPDHLSLARGVQFNEALYLPDVGQGLPQPLCGALLLLTLGLLLVALRHKPSLWEAFDPVSSSPFPPDIVPKSLYTPRGLRLVARSTR